MDASVSGVDVRDDGIGVERRKLEAKAWLRKVEAGKAGHLLPHEMDNRLRTDITTVDTARAKGDKAMEKKHANINAILANKRVRLHDGKLYISQSVQGGIRNQVINAATQNTMQITANASCATCIVVSDLGSPELQEKMYAMMLGIRLCTPQLITNHGVNAPSIVFKSAVLTQRFLWISPEFRAQHQDFASKLVTCIGSPRSKWRIIVSETEFIRKYLDFTKGPREHHRNLAAVALVRLTQKAQALPRDKCCLYVGLNVYV